MRVALLTEAFARNMGYLENILPKYLARLGAEVHVITANLLPYHYMADFNQTYGSFMASTALSPGSVEACDGFTLHVLPHRRALGYSLMVGLGNKLRYIQPNIVQTTAAIGWLPVQAAFYKSFLGYKLFTGNHYHASVFPLAQKYVPPWDRRRLHCAVTRALPGWAVSLVTEKCYAITKDCADLVTTYFGVPRRKVDLCPLGVDTELFTPASSEKDRNERNSIRQRLGFAGGDIVCIYTGRFSEDKNPLLLGKAVRRLREMGQPFRGLFVGNGVQAHALAALPECVIHPFVPVQELGAYFRAADIAVWPTQESTSMLDAAACGLPIVVNHTMGAPERVTGNGATYRLNDLEDLVQVLLGLRDVETRNRLGARSAEKMFTEFSWFSLAQRRLRDYEKALSANGCVRETAAPKKFEMTRVESSDQPRQVRQ